MNSKILCIHPGVSYLPEIQAYKEYFGQFGVEVYDSAKDFDQNYNKADFDLLWYMMGVQLFRDELPTVHDYASLSTGRFPLFKNTVKKCLNQKPDLRLFLNSNVKNGLGFKDYIPFLYRDMGVSYDFFKVQKKDQEYDFVYVGAITKERGVDRLFDHFRNHLKDKSLLVIGSVPNEIYSQFANIHNIKFMGAVPYSTVPELASKAEYGINMMPDQYPFNIQTSTKLIEYCALGLKVITTNYEWASSFESKTKARFYKIDDSFENLSMSKIEAFDFVTPDVNGYQWNNIFSEIELIQNVRKII